MTKDTTWYKRGCYSEKIVVFASKASAGVVQLCLPVTLLPKGFNACWDSHLMALFMC